MLPHFRSASARVIDVSFATVDCTVHTVLCQQQGITHYPSILLYNGTAAPRRYNGGPDAGALQMFIEDLRNPSVEELLPEAFTSRVLDGIAGFKHR